MSAVLDDLTGAVQLRREELPTRVEALQDEVKKLQKQLQKGLGRRPEPARPTSCSPTPTEVNGAKLIVGEVPGGPGRAMRGQIDRLRQKAGSSVIVLGWKNDDGNAGLAVGVSDDLVKKGIKSNDVIKPVAEVIGGKGGGPPHLATAGGKDANKLPEALAKAVELGTALLEQITCRRTGRRQCRETSGRHLETDPRFPSGKWVGFFLDRRLPGRHQMEMTLTFADGRLDRRRPRPRRHVHLQRHLRRADGKCEWVKQYVERPRDHLPRLQRRQRHLGHVGAARCERASTPAASTSGPRGWPTRRSRDSRKKPTCRSRRSCASASRCSFRAERLIE